MTDKTPRAWDGALEQEFYTPDEIAASDARVGEIQREKVIHGLAACMPQTEEDAAIGCERCPYNGHPCGGNYQDNDHVNLPVRLIEDIRAMLKAQEPITPHMVDWGIYECPKCKTRVDKTYKFCKCCGRAVKWE